MLAEAEFGCNCSSSDFYPKDLQTPFTCEPIDWLNCVFNKAETRLFNN